MYRELRPVRNVSIEDPEIVAVEGPRPSKTFLQAAAEITIADLSMSLDNVLAVAAAAREHPSVLFLGLVLSVTLMGVAASVVARLIQRLPILAWAGLLMILYVALKMIWEGSHDVAALIA
jgi:predicted tellurium resistance membrane protein TerC